MKLIVLMFWGLSHVKVNLSHWLFIFGLCDLNVHESHLKAHPWNWKFWKKRFSLLEFMQGYLFVHSKYVVCFFSFFLEKKMFLVTFLPHFLKKLSTCAKKVYLHLSISCFCALIFALSFIVDNCYFSPIHLIHRLFIVFVVLSDLWCSLPFISNPLN